VKVFKKDIVNKQQLLNKLSKVEILAKTSKFNRCISHPIAYTTAILHRNVVYHISKQPLFRNTVTFFDEKMKVALPAATDIYLTGGKTHDSEIRLAKFLLNYLEYNDHFWDIGAHFGYFSLLASKIIGEKGFVLAVEAAPENYKILVNNVAMHKHINALDAAVSNINDKLTFYTFPTLFSEYNSFDIKQYENKEWFRNVKYNTIVIPAYTLDTLVDKYKSKPNIIKIDVEGAEHLVIEGAENMMQNIKPIFILEYIYGNDSPNKIIAIDKLKLFGYSPFIINDDGSVASIQNIDNFCFENNRDSENIVFIHSTRIK
jgi:FkbM family methyltransferase